VIGLALRAEALLADRFHIVRCLGRGGVGEVYEARDLELRVSLALKLLRSAIAADEQTAERFRREVLLSRKVTHPNVCRIFDVFHHRDPVREESEDPSPDVTFVTMELLSGETLDERLRRTGRFGVDEALPLVAQMASGLSAAHRAGVIHRDFKTANVLLVPGPDGATRAVITDFGLARAVETGENATPPITASGGMVGTFAYMAPEQVEGAETTAAADIYALGLVMYEMVTGRRPFVGDSPLATAVKRLKEAPASPRQHVPELDARWEAAILRCLERDPARRFARAEDVVAALAGTPAASPRPTRRRQRAFIAGMAVALMAGVCSGSHQHRGPARLGTSDALAAPAAALRPRLAVALLGFKNLSGRQESRWLSVAFSEMLSTELAASDRIRVVPGESVARLKMDLALEDVDTLSGDTLSRIKRSIGSDLVVLGSYLVIRGPSERIRLNLRMQDASTGETTDSFVETGTEAELLELVSRASVRLGQSLGIRGSAQDRVDVLRAAVPAKHEALRLYAEGLRRLRVLDLRGALEDLGAAVAEDPAHALTHAALAEAWAGLGYEAKARESARRASLLSGTLGRRERLWIQARHHETAAEWDAAIGLYRELWTSYPDTLEYGLQLAAAHIAAGRPRDVLPLLDAFRRLPEPAGGDPRIDLAEAQAAGALSDFRRMRQAAATAAAKGLALGARLLVARAYVDEAWAHWNLGEHQRASQILSEAKRLYADTGDRAGMGHAVRVAGLLLWNGGDGEAAKEKFHGAHAIFREVGNTRGMATCLDHLAMVLLKQGDIRQARQVRETALGLFRSTGNKGAIAVALTNLGNILLKAGDLAAAARYYDESLALHREVGNALAAGVALSQLGELRREQGDLAGARRAYEEALGIHQGLGQEGRVAQSLRGLAEVALFAGDLGDARRRAESALALRESLRERLMVAESRLVLSRISLEEGRAEPAAALARQAADEFGRRGAIDDQAVAQCALARSLLAQGDAVHAARAVAQAAELSRRSQSERTRLVVRTTEARVRGAGGQRADVAAAVEALQGILDRAAQAGLRVVEMEALLALGEVEMAGADAASGRARLRQLEADAQSRGFQLIARRAAAGRKG
jgi:tetratricopeptide (TPR) repeat protein